MVRASKFSLAGKLNKLLHLPLWFRRNAGYKEMWTWIGLSEADAFCMMDYSQSEEELRQNGARAAAQLRDALLISRDHRVLEVGCGVARIGRELAPTCGEWYGVDISETILARARQRTAHLPNVHLQVLPTVTLQAFADDFFDRVYCHAVLVHLDKEDLFKYLVEMRRVLKPRGLLYFDTFNLANDVAWERWQQECLAAPSGSRKLPHRAQLATREEMEIYTRRAELELLACLSHTFLVQVIATKRAPPENEAATWIPALRREVEARLPQLAPLH